MARETNGKIDGYLCWPFTTKGHFGVPSGIAPVLMDIKARHHEIEKPTEPYLFVPHSWNVNGKPLTDQALEKITGQDREELHRNEGQYNRFLGDNLGQVLQVAGSLAQGNADRSKVLMSPLHLMESGLHRKESIQTFEFRDDTPEYAAYIQRRFLDWYHRGIAYMDFGDGQPNFYLNIARLYAEKPLDKMLEGLNVMPEIAKGFANNYNNYRKDLPVSTIGGYGTPVPLYIDDHGNVEIAEVGLEPVDPRLASESRNHLLIVKPLVNCYLFAEYLAGKFQGFDTVNIANDHTMSTRVNFVSVLLSERSYRVMNMYLFNLLQNQQGQAFSFKRGVTQEIEDLEEIMNGLARFTILKNTKLGKGDTKLKVDSTTLARLTCILEGDKEWVKRDRVHSNLFKREVSIKEVVARGFEKGDVSLVLNFLADVLMHDPQNFTAKYYLSILL
jgi:hypothetical protein